MTRYKAVIAYDGSDFSGYQVQPNGRTVQEEIEKALKKMHKGNFGRIVASGRTDTGVHATGQVIHFDSPLQIEPEKFRIALQTGTPRDISFLSVEKVSDDFHARFDVTGKEYRYVIDRSKIFNPFKRDFALHFPYALDLEKMGSVAKLLIGEHDFTSFCSARAEQESKVRTIYHIEIVEVDETTLMISYQGSGFLYNMVRILTGVLLDAGQGKLSEADILRAFNAKSREALRSKTAPPEGLYLHTVFYD
ncbi:MULTISPECIES: tRNA pseudouridine(38-40) synthase TruA [Listeria]|uniref:tRNA pseudouridine(38-40) synthase TruA n=1 Tax=Listeria TaxID=1637 RepID=UPI000B58FD86|nr:MULTISPECIES: tRNA pseudouridine(38-40) synthase TruA [Listeria]